MGLGPDVLVVGRLRYHAPHQLSSRGRTGTMWTPAKWPDQTPHILEVRGRYCVGYGRYGWYPTAYQALAEYYQQDEAEAQRLFLSTSSFYTEAIKSWLAWPTRSSHSQVMQMLNHLVTLRCRQWARHEAWVLLRAHE